MIRSFLILALAVSGCKAKRVFRDADTFTAETLAALARQEEASAALKEAALAAAAAGDLDTCVRLAEPALLIDVSAKVQAYRALWLAGLPYPASGEGPQADPGEPPAPRPADQFCGQETP